jgi:hypothetical protein
MIGEIFNKFQLDEIAYKLRIVADEPDLQESYEVDEAWAEALHDKVFYATPGQAIYFSEKEVEVICGEIDNLINIRENNWEDAAGLPQERRAIRTEIKQLCNIIHRLDPNHEI